MLALRKTTDLLHVRIATTTPPTFGVMTLHYSLQIIIEEVVIAEHAVVEYERLVSGGAQGLPCSRRSQSQEMTTSLWGAGG